MQYTKNISVFWKQTNTTTIDLFDFKQNSQLINLVKKGLFYYNDKDGVVWSAHLS